MLSLFKIRYTIHFSKNVLNKIEIQIRRDVIFYLYDVVPVFFRLKNPYG